MIIIKSDIVPLHGAAISMIGGRPENQDDMAFLDTPLGFLIIVCDGMGGGPGGKTASYIVKHEIAETICKCSLQTSRDHALKMATARAHKALEDRMTEMPSLNGMGSTFVAVLFNSHSAMVAHAGDSRCYRLQGNKCLYRSQDHSLVTELVNKKVMTEEEARLSPQSNVITRGLGSTNNHVPEIEEIPYRKGDRFVLCTDGVWGIMPHQELLKVFTQSGGQPKIISDLSAKIDKIGFSNGGGHDNYTIAMFEMEKDSLMKESIPWKRLVVISSALLLTAVIFAVCLWAVLNTNERNRHATMQSVSHPSEDVNPGIHTSSTSFSVSQDTNKKSTSEDNVSKKPDEKERNNEMRANSDASDTGIKCNHINDTLYNKLIKKVGRTGKETDNNIKQKTQQQNKKIVPSAKETAQKIINRYKSAQLVGAKSLNGASKSIEKKKKDILKLLDELCEQTKNSDTHQTAQAIRRAANDDRAWYIGKDPDKKSKLYKPTATAIGLMNKQIDRLKNLIVKLERETE